MSKEVKLNNGGAQFRFTPDTFDKLNGGVITHLHAVCLVVTDKSNQIADILSSQALSITGVVAPIKFRQVSGYYSSQSSVPFSFSTDISALDLSALNFEQFAFKQVKLSCQINNNADMQGLFSGTATLMDSKGEELMTKKLDQKILEKKSITQMDFVWNDLVLRSIPARVRIDGIIKSNDGSNYTLSDNNTIGGTATLTIPLSMKVKKGSYLSTDLLKISKDISAIKEHVTSADLLMEAHNGIPASLSVFLSFYDKTGNLVLTLPKDAMLTIPSAEESSPGKLISKISIDSTDLPVLLNAYRYQISTSFDTPSDRYVDFKSSNALQLRLNIQCTVTTH
jgi:hypothetical protein